MIEQNFGIRLILELAKSQSKRPDPKVEALRISGSGPKTICER